MTIIPVHHFSSDRNPIGVERIVKLKEAVQNEVHRHDFHELFFFDAGDGEHMIDLEHFAFKAPCCHIVAPGQVHRLARTGATTGTVVMFAGDLDLALAENAKQRLFGPGAPAVLSLNKTRLTTALKLIDQMEAELGNSQIISINFLGILLMKCAEWSAALETGKNNISTVERFRAAVEERFKSERKVANYASELGLSAGHLNELCKKSTGRTAGQLIADRTLLEAKRLLLHSELTVKQIAYSLNMEDPAYFSRKFKAGTGKSPQTFREGIREKYK